MKIAMILLFIINCSFALNAQDQKIILKPFRSFTPEEKAQILKRNLFTIMEEQITRSLNSMQAGSNGPKTFYAGLNVIDRNTIIIHSTLGSPVKSDEVKKLHMGNTRVLIGNFEKNNLNSGHPREDLVPMLTSATLPAGECIDGFRRKIRMGLEAAFRLSVETYSATQGTNLSSEWADLPDYMPGTTDTTDTPQIHLIFDTDKLVQYANEASSLFKNPILFNSWVKIAGYKQNTYYLNSEGKKATYPGSVFRLALFAETMAEDGERLELCKLFYQPDENTLPDKKVVATEINGMIGLLAELIKAPVFDDVYFGPVLFSGQAAGEIIRRTMFSPGFKEGLIARRINTATSAQGNILTEERMGTRVSSIGLHVKSLAGIHEFNKTPLTGFYPIDVDGSEPQEITLIEDGVLKNLLCGRIPTLKMKKSNGHCRLTAFSNFPLIVPGIVNVDFSGGVSNSDLRKKLLEMAREEGLNYALIVEECSPDFREMIKVYKVDVNTGKETLVRAAGIKGLKFSDLKKITAASNQKMVVNTTVGEEIQPKSDFLNGCPATFITPDALLFKEIEVTKNNRPNMAKLPVVKNPMEL